MEQKANTVLRKSHAKTYSFYFSRSFLVASSSISLSQYLPFLSSSGSACTSAPVASSAISSGFCRYRLHLSSSSSQPASLPVLPILLHSSLFFYLLRFCRYLPCLSLSLPALPIPLHPASSAISSGSEPLSLGSSSSSNPSSDLK